MKEKGNERDKQKNLKVTPKYRKWRGREREREDRDGDKNKQRNIEKEKKGK